MHNIAIINGRESMSYSGEPPWHSLGTEMTRVDSVDQALIDANLNWLVSKQPVFLQGESIPWPNQGEVEESTPRVFLAGAELTDIKAVMRDIDQQVLGTVGSRYQLIQNNEAFAPLQYAIDEYGATIETAGALGIGDRVWMLCKLNPDGVNEVSPGDIIEAYFLVTNSHTRERSQGLIARFTPVRVVCQNTLDMALSSSARGRGNTGNISIRHTISATDRIAEIERLISTTLVQHYQTVEFYQQLRQIDISLVDMATYTLRVWPVPSDAELEQLGVTREEYKPSEDLARRHSLFLFQNGNGHELAGSTAYGAYQAITEFIDHVSVLRQDGKPKTQGAMSALFGAGSNVKARALTIARDMFMSTTEQE